MKKKMTPLNGNVNRYKSRRSKFKVKNQSADGEEVSLFTHLPMIKKVNGEQGETDFVMRTGIRVQF